MNAAAIATVSDKVFASFPFEVNKLPLSGPDNLSTPHYGLFKSDDGECMDAAVKGAYVPHTVDDVAACVEAAAVGFKSEHDIEVTCKWAPKKGHRVIVQPSKEYRLSIYGDKDNVFPRAIIRADYGRGFRADFGLYRDACRNLMMVRNVEGISVSLRHTANLRTKLDELITDFTNLAGVCDNVYEIATTLESRRVEVADFLSELYPGTKKTDKSRAQSMISRMLRERAQTGRPAGDVQHASLWELVNAVTGYVQHNKKRVGSPDQVGRALAAIEDKEADAAWRLAMAMAG